MTTAPEVRRVAGVGGYGLLDAPPRRDLVAVAELAARICDVPMATVNIFTETTMHQVAAVGFDSAVCRRADSMCSVVVDSDGPVVVTDARLDPRFRKNPFVTGELGQVRFYAAHQLRTPQGDIVGTLCVFDTIPRSIAYDQAGALATLAERVEDILELTLRSQELTTSLARLEIARAELEQSNHRLAELAGQVSHDLKTPLTSLSLSLELLRDELLDGTRPETAMPLLERAIRGSRRMAGMIDEVLGFARLGGSLRRVDVDLDAVLDEVLVDLGDALEGVVVTIDDLPTVQGDPVQLRAVLQNLLSNAAKFRIAANRPSVRVSAGLSRGLWRIEVADNGPGVALVDRDRLFEPLARGDSSVEGMVEGSGIGLATCRRIIDAHGGRIALADTPGGGTTAWFELPSG